MRFIIIFFILFASTSFYSQEIGNVNNKNHSLKLIKKDNLYAIVYSDVNSKNIKQEKSFSFQNKNNVFDIIKDGFEKSSSHQIFVLTDIDNVVKFEYSKWNNQYLFRIKHSDLKSKSLGTSYYFTQNDIANLFGNL